MKTLFFKTNWGTRLLWVDKAGNEIAVRHAYDVQGGYLPEGIFATEKHACDETGIYSISKCGKLIQLDMIGNPIRVLAR